MAVKGIPFWEEEYKDIDNFTFSSEPNKTIKEFEKLIHKQADILEARHCAGI